VRVDRLIGFVGGAFFVCMAAPLLARAQGSVQTPPQNPQAEQSSTPASSSGSTTSQNPPQPAAPNPQELYDPAEPDKVTLLPHSDTEGYWISAQANVVFQWHPSFPAKYTGTNSMTPEGQSATTHVITLYTGWTVTPTTELFADFEYATGGGIGRAFGLAGYTNLDSVRTVSGAQLSTTPYLARLMLRQIIPLTDEKTTAERDELHLATSLPARRIEFRIGKFDLADFFDLNTWGQDSHLQFLNWTVDNNGAYDYAANTRGYTDGALVEYDDHWFAARFAVVMEPKSANGINLDANITRARAENLELQASGKLIADRAGTVRLLSYVNQADMGSYKQAIAEFLDHETATPNIIDTRRQGRHRYGFGLNFEQSLTDDIGVFGRLGWSDGRNEAWAYTEDDRELELGAFSMGTPWHRRNDRAGVAFVANGIVAAHQQYLGLGGLGFLLGDGALTYGPEKIFEGFYTVHLWSGFFASFDIQHINNPGYNQDRGPITVPGLRLHVDF
jgi:high affinity Mn2+ porin